MRGENLLNWSYEEFEKYNEDWKNDKYRLSESSSYKLDVIKKWIDIRDNYTMITNIDEVENANEWEHLQVVDYPSKYGTSFIYIDKQNKKWRVVQTAGEFYGDRHNPFEF